MIHFGPITKTSDAEQHCIVIVSELDGIHISMTDNVAEVIKYPNGDVKIIGKQDTPENPYWMLTGHDSCASMVNNWTGEREEFNSAEAWIRAAEAAGITVTEME